MTRHPRTVRRLEPSRLRRFARVLAGQGVTAADRLRRQRRCRPSRSTPTREAVDAASCSRTPPSSSRSAGQARRRPRLRLRGAGPALQAEHRTPGQRAADIVPERGVVDYILAANAGNEPSSSEDYVCRSRCRPGAASCRLMPAGAAPSGDYWRALTKLAKRGMLSDPNGILIADFLELKFRLEEDLKPDFLLIDARTGITELTGHRDDTARRHGRVPRARQPGEPGRIAGRPAQLRSGRAARWSGSDRRARSAEPGAQA